MTAFKALSAAAVLGGGFLAMAGPASADHQVRGHHPHVQQTTTVVINVSCFRGPSSEVIWDRPNPQFVDSLVAAGYSFPEAHAIAERVCRDAASVNRPENAEATMYRIFAENPPRG
ncbi:hypothetical protein [Roseicyclus persicicus]|uniref:DUF732 domain-containing protein n=1 Tax=Roseicyclus persicicus TaxID=2650661 RepID=A0A7X6GVN1_9RHOB|nr:hypothetical protein [Roseibacterium persicicum]NKX43224.1 hypothetical protein [Roseibacterium persicicum]